MDDIIKTPYLNQTCRKLSHGPGYGMTKFLNRSEVISAIRSIDACGILAFYQLNPVGWLLYTYEPDHMEFSPKMERHVAIFLWMRIGASLVSELD